MLRTKKKKGKDDGKVTSSKGKEEGKGKASNELRRPEAAHSDPWLVRELPSTYRAALPTPTCVCTFQLKSSARPSPQSSVSGFY